MASKQTETIFIRFGTVFFSTYKSMPCQLRVLDKFSRAQALPLCSIYTSNCGQPEVELNPISAPPLKETFLHNFVIERSSNPNFQNF